MISETGRVIAVRDGRVWVETLRQGACARCAVRAGCGQSLMASLFSSDRQHLCLPHSAKEPLAVHDEVEIGIPERGLLLSATLAYLVPLVGLLAGAMTGQYLAGEVVAVLAAGLGLLSGVTASRWLLRSGMVQLATPVLLRRLGSPHNASASI